MEFVADLHIHSKYSRGTSKNMDIKHIARAVKIKGVDVVGTGDFTHPMWLKELKNELDENLEYDGVKFIPSTEISLIYKDEELKDEKTKKIHIIILAPNLDIVEQISEYLGKKGRLDYDGRPIFGIHAPELVESLTKISNKIEIIPAHIWTPWFSLFGSNSGFDSVSDCFKDQTKKIHALETGLSSDPSMNWMISELDKYNLVSFSDSHSFHPWRIGREATIFDLNKFSYDKMLKAIRTGDGLKYTVEVNPAYGKYHFDGHRKCNISLEPNESEKNHNICPVCKKPLTIGVLHRVYELADRKYGFKPSSAKDFKILMPLYEIISTVVGKGMETLTVKNIAKQFLNEKNEFDVLLKISEEELVKIDEKVGKAVIKIRNEKYEVIPGYDGEYGKLELKEKRKKISDFF